MQSARVVLALLVAVLVSGAAAAKPASSTVRPTGVFSSLKYVAEAGDVIGFEIFIVSGRSGYSALVQIAEGEPSDPELVAVSVSGLQVELPIPSLGESVRFKGRVTSRGLEGDIVGLPSPLHVVLPRRKSYWQ